VRFSPVITATEKTLNQNLIDIEFHAQKPDANLNNFEGEIYFGERKELVGSHNFAMKGASIKNTAWIVGYL